MCNNYLPSSGFGSSASVPFVVPLLLPSAVAFTTGQGASHGSSDKGNLSPSHKLGSSDFTPSLMQNTLEDTGANY